MSDNRDWQADIELWDQCGDGGTSYETEICSECGGSGFSGYGTGYDAVCDSCGGIGEVIVGVKTPVMDKEAEACQKSEK